jgi:hypothetical protein
MSPRAIAIAARVASAACVAIGAVAGCNNGIGAASPEPDLASAETYLTVWANRGSGVELTGDFRLGARSATCTLPATELGGCYVERCDATVDPTMKLATIDPGPITYASTTLGSGPLTLTAGFAEVTRDGKDFAPGEAVSLFGGGTDVAAFDASVAVPAALGQVDIDGCTSGTSASPCLIASAPTVSWSGGTPGTHVVVVIARADAGSGDTLVRCTFPTESQRGSISPAALAKLTTSAADAGIDGDLGVLGDGGVGGVAPNLSVSIDVHSPHQLVSGGAHSLAIYARRTIAQAPGWVSVRP